MKLASLGIRASDDHQRMQYNKYDVWCLEARDFPAHGREVGPMLQAVLPTGVPVYVTFDVDVLEPVCR